MVKKRMNKNNVNLTMKNKGKRRRQIRQPQQDNHLLNSDQKMTIGKGIKTYFTKQSFKFYIKTGGSSIASNGSGLIPHATWVRFHSLSLMLRELVSFSLLPF